MRHSPRATRVKEGFLALLFLVPACSGNDSRTGAPPADARVADAYLTDARLGDARGPDLQLGADVSAPTETGRTDTFVEDAATTLSSFDASGVDAELNGRACVAAGGFCSENRWTLCPAHYEPIGTSRGRHDCPTSGWCCVAAPPSPCSNSGAGNCVLGDTCTGCWYPATGEPACESGRVCCIDTCDTCTETP